MLHKMCVLAVVSNSVMYFNPELSVEGMVFRSLNKQPACLQKGLCKDNFGIRKCCLCRINEKSNKGLVICY